MLRVEILVALLSGWALWRNHYRLARVARVGHVRFLLLGWGLSQYPYLIYPDVTLVEAATPAVTLRFVLYLLPFGAAILIQSLWFLFRVFKTERLKT